MYFKTILLYSFLQYVLTLHYLLKINENSSLSISLKHLKICHVLECNFWLVLIILPCSYCMQDRAISLLNLAVASEESLIQFVKKWVVSPIQILLIQFILRDSLLIRIIHELKLHVFVLSKYSFQEYLLGNCNKIELSSFM